MSPPPVPWPGYEPQPFEFPYEQAATARTALVELSDEVSTTLSVHVDSYGGISDANQGDTMALFRLSHDARMESGGWADLLVWSAIWSLDDLVARAHAAEQQRADAHAAWASRKRAYDAARANGDAVGARPGSRGGLRPI